MTKLFRGCRYQVVVDDDLWSRHSSFVQARRSFREAVNNKRGDHKTGATVDLRDAGDGEVRVLEQGLSGW
jgi:hypothetical protein